MKYAVPAPEIATVPVAGSDAVFPVHRIYCVGRNYAAHAREMGHDPDRDPPFFFTKPADAIVVSGPGGAAVPYPPQTADLHHEIEMVVAIGREGAGIAEAAALDHVFGYAVGIDLTRRDLQRQAKDKGRPWDTAKGFDFSAPCAPIHAAADIGHPARGAIWLRVNGETCQSGDIGQLIWSVPEVVSILSGLFTLKPGDLIYTGTPAGVGAVGRGDVMTGGIDGLGEIEVAVE